MHDEGKPSSFHRAAAGTGIITRQQKDNRYMRRVINFFRKTFSIRRKKPIKILRMEVFLNNVVTSHAFAKMTLQEKLLSLGRLMDLFHKDYGFTPKTMETLVGSLNKKLNKEMMNLWQKSYTQYFDSSKRG